MPTPDTVGQHLDSLKLYYNYMFLLINLYSLLRRAD